MECITDKIYTNERFLAYSIIDKLKNAAFKLKSNNPTHLNGTKYSLAKEKYDYIINFEFDKRKLSSKKREMIKNFINQKLKKA